MSSMTESELVDIIRALVKLEGVRGLAKRLSVDPSLICRINLGQRKPGRKVAYALGFDLTTAYERTKSKGAIDNVATEA